MFEVDMTLGDAVDPVILNVQLAIDIDVSLAQGWNWMSLNVYTEDMSLSNMLASIDGNAQYMKGQFSYADYYSEFGWFGTLETMDNLSMYKLNMSSSDNIVLAGVPTDVPTTMFSLPTGWNWIGYTNQIFIDP